MLSLLVRIQTSAWQLRNRFRDERGQTSSEYLVIAGVITAIIIGVLMLFKNDLQDGIKTFGARIKSTLK